ncbi:MAG: DUF1849 family protein [Rhodospirillaceae bacterium]
MSRRASVFRAVGPWGWVPVLLGVLMALADAAVAAGPLALAGHRVVYEIQLLNSRDGAGPTGARGLMAYEFSDACERWVVDNRIVLDVVYGEETPVRIDWTFTSWETKDGRQFGYTLVHKRNNQMQEELRGKATLSGGGAGKAVFTGDPDMVVPLPEGTLFPTAHLVDSFAAVKAGKKTFSRTLFDGTSLENPYDANVLFLKPKQPNTGAAAVLKAAGFSAGVPVWQMRVAFFSIKRSDGTPVVELVADYREDGVAERIVQDFPDFSLLMRPVKAEKLKGGC